MLSSGGSRPGLGGTQPPLFVQAAPVFPPTTYYCDGRHNVHDIVWCCDIVWCRYTSLMSVKAAAIVELVCCCNFVLNIVTY